MKMTDCFSLLKIRKLREYQPVSLRAIPGRFAFFDGQSWVDCQMSHILYEPMLVLISFQNHDGIVAGSGLLRIHTLENPEVVAAELSVNLMERIDQTKSVYLFAVTKTDLKLSGWREMYLRRIYRAGLRKGANFMTVYNFDIYKKLAALFCVPKQVWLVSTKSGKDISHFPVDLCAKAGDSIVIGVRNSNKAMSGLIPGDTFYLSEAASQDYREIYALGKFSAANKQASFLATDSDFALPELICSYRKLTLSRKIKFDKQSLYIAETMAPTVADASKTRLYHIHKIWLLHYSDYDRIETHTA